MADGAAPITSGAGAQRARRLPPPSSYHHRPLPSGGRGVGRADLSPLAIPVAIGTIVVLLTAPIWLIYLAIAGVLAVWSLDAPIGPVLGMVAIAAPFLGAVVLGGANLRCARDADRAVVSARTVQGLDEGRVRRAWSTAGLVASAFGGVAYLIVLVVSVGW